MGKVFIIIGSISGAIAVAIGAFGAHALKNILETNQKMNVFETGSKYHFYHSIALVLIGMIMLYKGENKWIQYSGYMFISGIFLFSGSLYVLATTNQSKLGMITPVGGLGFILGWVFLTIYSFKL